MNGDQAGTIWIDFSHTWDSGLKTGIQRVVRSIVDRLPEAACKKSRLAKAVVLREGVFRDADLYSSRWGTSSFRNWKQQTRFRRFGYLPMKLFFSARAVAQRLVPGRTSVSMKSGDWLLLTDGYWALDSVWPAVDRARQAGVKIALVLYDLLPVTHPQFFPSRNRSRFEAYLKSVSEYVDLVLPISNAVTADYLDYSKAMDMPKGGPRTQLVKPIALGADFASSKPPAELAQNALGGNTPDNSEIPYVLQVGTLEPRKNHKAALAAMQSLWKRGHDLRYFAVGRQGWMCDDILQSFNSHPLWQKKLFHIADADDQELAKLYYDCAAVICPSFAEGFGLPIVEGLQYRKPVIASDIPIHREVGGDACAYFPVTASDILADRLEECIFSRSQCHESLTSHPSVKSWGEAIEALLETLIAHS